jgi:hypothetical protein
MTGALYLAYAVLAVAGLRSWRKRRATHECDPAG